MKITFLRRMGAVPPLALAALLLASSALYGAYRLSRSSIRLTATPPGEGMWAIFQAENELLKLIALIHAQTSPTHPSSLSDILLRFDIVWSRVDVLTHGEVPELVGDMADYWQTMNALQRALAQAETLLPRIEAEDELALRQLYELLHPHVQTLRQLNVNVVHRHSNNYAEKRSKFRQLNLHITIYFTAAMLSGAIIAGLFAWQIRALAREVAVRRQAEMRAEAANHAKSEFLANMSHELRTPLHGLLSFANLGHKKVETGPPAKLRNYFQKIEKSGPGLLVLINDLLDLAKLEAGKMDFAFQPMELQPLLLQAGNEFQTLLAERQLTLETEMPERPVKASLDSGRIRQVFRNLLSNAVKFSPEGGTITCRLHADAGTVVVSVIDEGPGIPAEELETIFDKFIQLSKTRTGAGGTGLGLAICRRYHHRARRPNLGRTWAGRWGRVSC